MVKRSDTGKSTYIHNKSNQQVLETTSISNKYSCSLITTGLHKLNTKIRTVCTKLASVALTKNESKTVL